jgi:hypothetical protein
MMYLRVTPHAFRCLLVGPSSGVHDTHPQAATRSRSRDVRNARDRSQSRHRVVTSRKDGQIQKAPDAHGNVQHDESDYDTTKNSDDYYLLRCDRKMSLCVSIFRSSSTPYRRFHSKSTFPYAFLLFLHFLFQFQFPTFVLRKTFPRSHHQHFQSSKFLAELRDGPVTSSCQRHHPWQLRASRPWRAPSLPP